MKQLNFKAGAAALSLSLLTCTSCILLPEPDASYTAINTPVAANPWAAGPSAGIKPPSGKKKIKIALLLDTSNSMDGLIEQAKSQLWKLVNELSGATCDNEKPELEIALYEYGNDRLSSNEGYIRQVSLFTNDLDVISEKLFALTTRGGSEFCGYVINTSLSQLDWQGDGDFKVIFIAGNEPFNQGPVDPTIACKIAKEKDVVINTIYCGDFEEGLNSGWKNGAFLAKGEFMSINQDQKTVYIETPYDMEIAALNSKLNETYVSYGKRGRISKSNQSTQDANAASYSWSNMTERTVSKASSYYTNKTWDLVDASDEKQFDIEKIKEEDLPKELRGKTKEEKEKFIAIKKGEREVIKKRILELNKQRLSYIAEKQKTISTTNSLDASMIKAIKEQAAKKRFMFES